MKVVWATDQNYLKPTLVSILSLLEHASGNVDVHVMGHGLSGGALDLLARVVTAHPGTTFAHIPLDGDPRILHFAGVAPNPWTPTPRVYFEDAHYLKEFGRDVLLYRETASRLFERVLGPGTNVMNEIDFGAL